MPSRETNTKHGVGLTLSAALLLLLFSALPLLHSGVPATIRPLPILFILPVLLGVPPLIAILLPSILFCIWSGPLFRGSAIPSRRTLVATTIVGMMSAVYFYSSWRYGVKYQGYGYTLTMTLFSSFFAAAVGSVFALSRRTHSLAWSLAANLLLFVWVSTFAFPYLGELP
jgi:hypothetical protein